MVVFVTVLSQVRVAGAAGSRGGHFRELLPTEEENYTLQNDPKQRLK